MWYIVVVLCAKDKLQERNQEQQSCSSDEHLGFGSLPNRAIAIFKQVEEACKKKALRGDWSSKE